MGLSIQQKLSLSILLILFSASIIAISIPKTYANVIVDTQDVILEYGEQFDINENQFFNSESVDVNYFNL